MFIAHVNEKEIKLRTSARYIPLRRSFKEEELTRSYKHFVPTSRVHAS